MKKVLILAVALMLAMAPAFAAMNATVFSPRMQVYFAPSTSSETIGALGQRTDVVIEALMGDWARVNYKGYIGFAPLSDMVVTDQYRTRTNRLSTIIYITRDNITPRYGTLDRNTPVFLRSLRGDYAMISDAGMNVLAIIPRANLG